MSMNTYFNKNVFTKCFNSFSDGIKEMVSLYPLLERIFKDVKDVNDEIDGLKILTKQIRDSFPHRLEIYHHKVIYKVVLDITFGWVDNVEVGYRFFIKLPDIDPKDIVFAGEKEKEKFAKLREDLVFNEWEEGFVI